MIDRPTAALFRALIPLLAITGFSTLSPAAPTAEEIAAAPQLEAPLPSSANATSPSNPVWTWSADTDQLVEIVLQLSSSSRPPTTFATYASDDTTSPLPVTGGRFSASAGTTYIFAAETAADTPLTLLLRPASPFSTWLHNLPESDGSSTSIPDLHRFVFGIDPTTPTTAVHPNFPALHTSGGHLELTYTLRDGELSNSTGTITLEGQVSTDGRNWTAVAPLPLGDNRFAIRTPLDPNTPTKQLRIAVHSSEPITTSSSSTGVTSQWATSDPAAAVAWLSSLDPGSPARNDALAAQWTRNNPEDAAAWLEALEGRGGRGRR